MSELGERLARLRGLALFDIPTVGPRGTPLGNNGDALIELGAQQLFRQHGLRFVERAGDADVLLIRGSGSMLERYTVFPKLFRDYLARFPETPLVMLPASFWFPTRDFAASLPPRSAPVELHCRERTSYDHLTREQRLPSFCTVHLGHDTAFALAGTPFLARYRGRRPEHVLIVERDDPEHPARFAATASRRRAFGHLLPRGLARAAYRARARWRASRPSAFRERCEVLLRANHPETAVLPRLIADVSRPECWSFDGFCDAIADAAAVFTTRLHVGVFAALLGKPTYLFEGPYHKIRAVYEHSMAGLAHVTLLPSEDDRAAA